MWNECGIEVRLRAIFQDRESLYLYGDPAYLPGYGIIGPYRAYGRDTLSRAQQAANIHMSGERITVEWAFGLVTKSWAFTAFKRVNRVGLSPVPAYYICATLLTNITTCLRGHNQISLKYNLSPPSLEEYLRATGDAL